VRESATVKDSSSGIAVALPCPVVVMVRAGGSETAATGLAVLLPAVPSAYAVTTASAATRAIATTTMPEALRAIPTTTDPLDWVWDAAGQPVVPARNSSACR
jgi:hypothetical protein